MTPRTILQWPNFLERLRDAFKTDVPLELVPRMLKLALSIDSSRVVQGAVGFDRGLSHTVIAENGAYVLEPNVPLIQAYAAELIRHGESLPAMEGGAAGPRIRRPAAPRALAGHSAGLRATTKTSEGS